MKRWLSEFIGTFTIVFAGCGAIIVDGLHLHSLGPVGISLVFGFAVMAMIYSLGDVSGAHFNPAVSFGFWRAKRLSAREMMAYAASQIAGAILASILLKFLFPGGTMSGETLPAPGLWLQAFVFEMILTAILMFVILSVSTGSKEKGLMAGLAIGVTVAMGAMFGGSISGASMNPARSLAPALIGGHFEFLWIYLTAPFLGSLLAVALCKGCQEKGCCA